MAAQVVVPQLGESVVEARVARWLKKEGEAIAVGDPLVELETEKIDLEVNADQAGVLAKTYEDQLAHYRAAPDDAAKLLATGESPRDASLAPAEHAAMTMMANLILNLDEAITKE